MFSREIQKFISSYLIFGFIPLDKVLHVAIGMLITIFLRLCKCRMKTVFLVLAGLELVKEIVDLKTLQSSWLEGMVDFLVTFAYPILLLIVIEMKKKAKT